MTEYQKFKVYYIKISDTRVICAVLLYIQPSIIPSIIHWDITSFFLNIVLLLFICLLKKNFFVIFFLFIYFLHMFRELVTFEGLLVTQSVFSALLFQL